MTIYGNQVLNDLTETPQSWSEMQTILEEINENFTKINEDALGKDDSIFTAKEITTSVNITRNARLQYINIKHSAEITLTMPLADANNTYIKKNDSFIFIDADGNCDTNNVNIDLNGSLCNDSDSDIVMSKDNAILWLRYEGWDVVNEVGVYKKIISDIDNSNSDVIYEPVFKNIEELKAFYFDFYNYGTQFKSVTNAQSSETWTAGNVSTTVSNNTTSGEFINGVQSKKLSTSATGNDALQAYRNVSLDLSKFSDTITTSYLEDKIEIKFYLNNQSYFQNLVYVWFYTNSADKFGKRARIQVNVSSLSTGWNILTYSKKEFTYDSGFVDADWSSLAGIYFYAGASSTSAQISFAHIILYPASGKYNSLLYSGTSNSDVSVAGSLTLPTARLENMILSYFINRIVFLDNTTNAYGKSFQINTSTTTNEIIYPVSGSFPTKTNNVLWEIQRPLIEVKQGNFFWATDDTTALRLCTVSYTGASDKFALINTFKPQNNNRKFWVKGHFQFLTNSQKQGFTLFYKDTSNHLLVYILKAGASSKIKVDQVIAGVATNLYESSTFTISDNDCMILITEINGGQIKIYNTTPNGNNISLNKVINFYHSTLDPYIKDLGIYADLQLRLLELEGSILGMPEQRSFGTASGTFATASTLTITDSRIHKNSIIEYRIRSAPVGNIYLSSISEGSCVFTSSSGSETAQINIQIYN